MQCPGSANLELAIPGFEEPWRDDAAGAKGVGTRIHTAFAALGVNGPSYLAGVAELVAAYADLHWRKRRDLLDVANEHELITWVENKLAFFGTANGHTFAQWLIALDRKERLPPSTLRYIAETVRHLIQLLHELGPAPRKVIEKTIECTWLPSSPRTTPDLLVMNNGKLAVVDYKTGRIPVSPVDNYQLMFYAWSFLWHWFDGNVTLDRNVPDEIILIIWQPGNFESHTITLEELKEWARLARRTDLQIERKVLTLNPGTACTFCPANPHSRGDKNQPYCPAIMPMLYPDKTNEEDILCL